LRKPRNTTPASSLLIDSKPFSENYRRMKKVDPTNFPTRDPTKAPTEAPSIIPTVETLVPSSSPTHVLSTLPLLPFEVLLESKNQQDLFQEVLVPFKHLFETFLEDNLMSNWEPHHLQRVFLHYEHDPKESVVLPKTQTLSMTGESVFIDNAYLPSLELFHSMQRQVFNYGIPQLEELIHEFGYFFLTVKAITVVETQDEQKEETAPTILIGDIIDESDSERNSVFNVPTHIWAAFTCIVTISLIAFVLMVCRKSKEIEAKRKPPDDSVVTSSASDREASCELNSSYEGQCVGENTSRKAIFSVFQDMEEKLNIVIHRQNTRIIDIDSMSSASEYASA
jgi:hypothetical protein